LFCFIIQFYGRFPEKQFITEEKLISISNQFVYCTIVPHSIDQPDTDRKKDRMEVIDAKLPQMVSYKIMEYLDPICTILDFKMPHEDHVNSTNYSPKYEMAYTRAGYPLGRGLSLKPKQADRQLLFSRIVNKNGNPRYYLTFQEMTKECEECGSRICARQSRSCSYACTIYETTYSSIFIGKDIENALFRYLTYSE
tara:strand:- start:57 stop:644 length:588 start_codon:yes stop_codon:yes gene_type:complete